ncbi:MAG: Pr6Pr family membrane protein, partial [Parafilimonas sp.]
MNNVATNQPPKTKKIVLFIIVFLGWFALVAQLFLIIQTRQVSIFETIVRYFSFFTILTNLLVTICCTILFADKKSRLNNFFSKPGTLTAIAVYIVIVGIVYNIIL